LLVHALVHAHVVDLEAGGKRRAGWVVAVLPTNGQVQQQVIGLAELVPAGSAFTVSLRSVVFSRVLSTYSRIAFSSLSMRYTWKKSLRAAIPTNTPSAAIGWGVSPARARAASKMWLICC
jgi:hypothetical protein